MIVSGPGLLATYDQLQVPDAPMFRLVNFRAGAADKVGGRDAKVVTYNVNLMGDIGKFTLWIDAETLLPLKRLMVSGDVPIIEVCNVRLDPKIEAGAFVLPK